MALTMALLMVAATTACGDGGTTGGGTTGGDSSKTQLTVYSYDGGVGNEWLSHLIDRFEEKYANYEFEPGSGKKGVEIVETTEKEGQDLSAISNMQDVLFSEYIDVTALCGSGSTLEITDIINTPLNEYLVDENGTPVTSDTQSIADKLYDETKDYFGSFGGGSKYFGLPHYSHFSSVIYNRALFENKKLYFAQTPDEDADENNLAGYFISSANPTRSCGPDGVEGNDDDGLPATWDEFFILCDYMCESSIIPFIWSSNSSGYTKYLLNATYLNLAGKQDASYNYTFNSGEDTINTVTFTGNTPVIKQETVSAAQYGALNRQLEKYQALEVYDRIIDTVDYQHTDCKNGADMLRAQEDYIFSYNEGKPVAFLLEGSYWYNEAEEGGFFDDVRSQYDTYDSMNDYRVMPLPRVYEGSASDVLGKDIGKTVIGDGADSLACINANIKNDANKVKLAKMFLAFCYTQESLEEFTEYTNTTRFLKYDMDTSKLTNEYARNLWNFVEASDIVLPYSSHSNFTNAVDQWSLHIQSKFWSYDEDGPYFKLKGSTNTAIDFFKSYSSR